MYVSSVLLSQNYSAINGNFPNVAPYNRSWERDGAEQVYGSPALRK
jgi:hypothetical protein